MNILKIAALKKPVVKTIEIPGSKSYTNRSLIMAALTKGEVTLYNPLYCEDTEVMIAALRTLGIRIETLQDQIIVYDDISIVENRSYDLFAKNSGTTARFLLALVCLTAGTKVIKGDLRLNERPIKDLVDTLRLLGAKIEYLEKKEKLPVKVSSSSLYQNRDVTMQASTSSQFLSALLMVAPILEGLKIHLHGQLISKPYVEMTIHAMQEFGVHVLKMEDGSYQIPSLQNYQKSHYVIEGDFSSAGYFFAIAALTGSTITVKNLNPNSAQADKKFLSFLTKMGNEIKMRDKEITIIGKQVLPLSLDMEDCPDLVQTMAVLSSFANGITTISGVRSLRLKETERVQALKSELLKMGIKTEDTRNTLTIYGGDPTPALIDTYGDHRMAMAFAIAGTKLPGMKIQNPEVVNKTFPAFWEKLGSLVS